MAPVPFVAVARRVAMSALPATPFAGGSAALSVATTSRASSSASDAAMGVTLPAAAASGATSFSGAPVGASFPGRRGKAPRRYGPGWW